MNYLDPLFLIKTLGLVGVIFIIFAESGLFFGFFLPGDSLLFTAGLFAAEGYISLPLLMALSFIAAVLGDNAGYAFGKKVGLNLFKKEDSFIFKKRYLELTKAFYEKHGKKAIVLARFTPIVRTFTPIFAGVADMPYQLFFAYNLIGGFLWTSLLCLLGFFLGHTFPAINHYITPIVIAIIIVSLIPSVIKLLKNRSKK